ncbi:MAG: AmmeMemoRadiSam system protein B [Bacteroidota bacterium]
MATIREPAVAGMFYPSVRATLNRDVEELLRSAAPRKPEGTLVALISPHAGYIYSGSTAAMGYTLLSSLTFDSVVIVGPSHRELFEAITVFPGDAYRTPLGDVQVDTALREELVRQSDDIIRSERGHRSEHAIEVQLPFLQKVLGEFKFLPIVMGSQQREYCEILSAALAKVVDGKNVLLVASSDLSHYHPHEYAVRLDRRVIEDVKAFNADALLQRLERQEVEACGGGPMVAVMKTAQKLGANRSHILQYCTSGDVTGEKGAVVGYLSVAFTSQSGSTGSQTMGLDSGRAGMN